MTDPVKRAERWLDYTDDLDAIDVRVFVRELIARDKEREAEVKALREERERDRLLVKCSVLCRCDDPYSPKQMEAELTSLRGVVEKLREDCNAAIEAAEEAPKSITLRWMATQARDTLSLLPKVT